jgi:hypothetical protein
VGLKVTPGEGASEMCGASIGKVYGKTMVMGTSYDALNDLDVTVENCTISAQHQDLSIVAFI